jgi:hypothetical protein
VALWPPKPKELLIAGRIFFFCDQRGVIEVALRIGVFQIDRGRNNGIADRQRARGHLDRAGAA